MDTKGLLNTRLKHRSGCILARRKLSPSRSTFGFSIAIILKQYKLLSFFTLGKNLNISKLKDSTHTFILRIPVELFVNMALLTMGSLNVV